MKVRYRCRRQNASNLVSTGVECAFHISRLSNDAAIITALLPCQHFRRRFFSLSKIRGKKISIVEQETLDRKIILEFCRKERPASRTKR